MSTRDADLGIEIQIDWRVAGAPPAQDPATSRTRARPEDYAEASERLVSRIAQQAAPRVATLIGKPPTYQARSPGQSMSRIMTTGAGNSAVRRKDGIEEKATTQSNLRFGEGIILGHGPVRVQSQWNVF